MKQRVGDTKADASLSELIDQVRDDGNMVTLFKDGQPAAVLVPVELFEHLQAEQSEDVAPMRPLQASVEESLSDKEAMALAWETQEVLRARLFWAARLQTKQFVSRPRRLH